MNRLKFSDFQLTFGQEETYLHPEKTYERLKKCGYDAIEITPPKGQFDAVACLNSIGYMSNEIEFLRAFEHGQSSTR